MIRVNDNILVAPTRVAGQVTTATQHLKPSIVKGDSITEFEFDDVEEAIAAVKRVGLKIEESRKPRLTTGIRKALTEDMLFTLREARQFLAQNSGESYRFDIVRTTGTGFIATVDEEQLLTFDFPFDSGAFDEITATIDRLISDPRKATAVVDGIRYSANIEYQYPYVGHDDKDNPAFDGPPSGFELLNVEDFDGHEVTDIATLKRVLPALRNSVAMDGK